MRKFIYRQRFTRWTWTLAGLLVAVIVISSIVRIVALSELNSWWDNLINLMQSFGAIILGLAVLFRTKD